MMIGQLQHQSHLRVKTPGQPQVAYQPSQGNPQGDTAQLPPLPSLQRSNAPTLQRSNASETLQRSEVRFMALDAELVRYAGDGNSALVLRQLFFWWLVSGRAPFYKFNDVCTHPCYRPGDSWQEETGLTRRQFEGARRHLATKIRRGTPEEIGRAFGAGVLAVYWTDGDHKSWYAVNEARVRAEAPTLHARYLTEKKGGTEEPTKAHPNKAVLNQPGNTSQEKKSGYEACPPAARMPPAPGKDGTQRVAGDIDSPDGPSVHRVERANGANVHRWVAPNGAPVHQPTWEAEGAVVHWVAPADGAVVHRVTESTDASVHQPSADGAVVHQPMAECAIGLIPETYSQKDLPETAPDLLPLPPSLPAVPSATEQRQEEGGGALERKNVGALEQRLRQTTVGSAGSAGPAEELHEGQSPDDASTVRSIALPLQRSNAQEEEGGEEIQSVSGEIALIQQALEEREVFPDPARRIAERAVRLGVGEAAVLARFEAHLMALGRDQVGNPLGTVVWRLLHRPLVMPAPVGCGRRRSRLTEAFFGEEDELELVATEGATAARSAEVAVAARVLSDVAPCSGGAPAPSLLAAPPVLPQEVATSDMPDGTLAGLWREVLQDLQGQMTRATFERWFPATYLVGVEAGVYLVCVPDEATRQILTHRLARLVQRALAWRVGGEVEMRFVGPYNEP